MYKTNKKYFTVAKKSQDTSRDKDDYHTNDFKREDTKSLKRMVENFKKAKEQREQREVMMRKCASAKRIREAAMTSRNDRNMQFTNRGGYFSTTSLIPQK
jgi:hypothetical protein